MKKTVTVILALGAMLAATGVFAIDGPALYAQNQPVLQPIPEAQPQPSSDPMPPVGAQPMPMQAGAVPLYHCVRYKDKCNIAPCAVPQIVMVKDPCAKCDPCNAKCVCVQICVPPCSACPPRVTCKRGGEYVKYDFGKYSVEITSRNGVVKVDYDS